MARVDILWGDDEGAPRIAPAILEDRSRGGLSVQMKTPVRVGCHVTVKWGSTQVSGKVTNSRRERGTYVIGVRLDTNQSLARQK